ncbi:MAG: hypothetical protein LBP56_00205 [Odoribacteraceae bacterium]|jgi:hypothetical protein|nr:hypothetical protein [Odoribacteraceae bacterium]
MITETTYYEEDLKRGKCKCCGEISSFIVKSESLCVDCLQEIEFIEACSGIMNKSLKDE